MTVFDEVALANDIQTACGTQTAPQPHLAQDSLSPEQRLERLQALKGKGLISEEEYLAKRSQILNDL